MTHFRRTRRQDPLHDVAPGLQGVLDAAAAPAAPSELVGLHAATAAFLSTSTVQERSVSSRLTKVLATPLAALVGVAGLSGVAVAAATDNLPAVVQDVVGADRNDDKAESPRSATATANITKSNRGRCTAASVASDKGLRAAPLAAQADADCADREAPGSSRSATATANLQGKTTGRPDTAGKPADAGKPDTAGQPETAGQPDTVEAPETAGKPEGAGKPATERGRSADAGRPADSRG